MRAVNPTPSAAEDGAEGERSHEETTLSGSATSNASRPSATSEIASRKKTNTIDPSTAVMYAHQLGGVAQRLSTPDSRRITSSRAKPASKVAAAP